MSLRFCKMLCLKDAMNGRDSCLLTSPDEVLLEQAYRRHERLDFFDYSTYTLEQLHPQLGVQ